MQDRWTVRPEGSNWGDFGADDERGRMNLITPRIRRKAAEEIREGIAFCLSLPLDFPGGNALAHFRKPPRFIHEKRGSGHNFNYGLSDVCGCFSDVVCDEGVTIYTQYSTQWDGLAHVGEVFDARGDGEPGKVYYNGYRAGLDIVGPDDSEEAEGARKLGIDNLAVTAVQGRGVLVDLERQYGRARTLVDYDALLRAMEAQKAEVEVGDFLCLQTGFAGLVLSMNKQPNGKVLSDSCAVLDGRDDRLLNWITDSGIVAICADNFAVEAYPSRAGEGEWYPALPLHNHCLFKLGVHLAELWNFAELSKWLAANGRTRFFLTAPPLRLPRAAGSPVTPIATV